MPLKAGKSTDVIAKNVEEMMKAYKETGMIGKTRPANLTEAQKIATAAAYSKAGKKKENAKTNNDVVENKTMGRNAMQNRNARQKG